ncbi:SusC/RagA family TonB-linked outer membrane protein [Sphingobacterium sp. SG20118]|uniref:SusC/RagA family TonB-linked outer membrane protein n=1 Tax=Sphingobacterium sp. SG20118 TaxID=3367156 RepID=UPI0037DFC680
MVSSGGPLILIDGVEGNLNMINPQDIESISVLKDAASSAIYGSRAPFGVILVTTKNGKAGIAKINYNNSFRISSALNRPKSVDSYRFATYFNDAAQNNKTVGKFTEERLQRIKDYMDGKITTVNIPDPSNPANWADGYDYANGNTDWWGEIYNKNIFAQEHTVSISGGSEKIQAYVSGNYLNSDGLMKVSKDTYSRYSTNAKVTAQLTDYLNLTYNMRYAQSNYDRPSNLGSIGKFGYQTWPMLPVYDDNGFLFNGPSPIIDIRNGGRSRSKQDLLSQKLEAVITPIKNWEIRADFNYSINRDRNHSNNQKVYNHNVAGEIIPNQNNSSVSENSYSNDYFNQSLTSTYSFDVLDDHHFKVMVGTQYENNKNNFFSASRNGIMVPYMDVIDITNGTNGSGVISPPSVGGNRNNWGVIGFFGRFNYNYKEKYIVEAVLRHDGTSRFRADQRWKTFPSFSAGWNIAKEGFWGDLSSHVSTFKIRGDYGKLGNQNTNSIYPTYVTMPVGTSNSGWLINNAQQNTANAPGLISTLLTWETITSSGLGVDVEAMKNRLAVSFDLFQRNTENMVGPAPTLPLILGTAVPKTNNTDLKTKGWELTATWKDVISDELSYHVGFNVSDNNTVITNYPNPTFDLGTYYTGQKVGQIWGYETIGIAKTQGEMDAHLASLPNGGQTALGSLWEAGDIMYKDLDGDGKIGRGANSLSDHGDLKVIGNNNPRYRFGINLGMKWKNIDASVFLQGVAKRDFWEGSYNYFGYTGYIWRAVAYEEHMDYFRADANHVMGQNLDAFYPRPVDNSDKNIQTQSKYLQNGAYIRLKNLQIGYTLPHTTASSLGIKGARFFFSGENLWTGTKVPKMFDPESLGAGTGSLGYPLSRTLSVGLNVNL